MIPYLMKCFVFLYVTGLYFFYSEGNTEVSWKRSFLRAHRSMRHQDTCDARGHKRNDECYRKIVSFVLSLIVPV